MTDNGKVFKNKEVLALCKGYQIRIIFSTPYYPHGTCQAEATNKIIRNIFLKIVNNFHRDWHARIPHTLWAYRTSIRTPIGATPFSLVYGIEVVLPLEIKIPSLCIALQDYITYANLLLDQLL